MAELDTSAKNGKQTRKPRAKKALPKVDLTAMVDLAFLLITFFMLTTTLSKPTALDIVKPDNSDPAATVDRKASETMTILLGKHDRLVAYMGVPGTTTPQVQSFQQIRKTILTNKFKVQQTTGRNLVMIIKPTSGAVYKNLVDIMDELNITGIVTAPAIDDVHILDAEKKFMKSRGLL
jgi:biopolymer transport protein ExbD